MGNRNHNFLLALATNFLWAAFLTATAATTTTLCVSLVYTGDLSFARNQIQRMQKSNHQMCFATIAEVKQQKSIALEKYTSNNWNKKFKASARIKLKTKIQCVNQVKCVYIQTQRASTIWWCLRSTKAKNGICHLTNPRQVNFKLKQCNTHRHSLIHSRIINYIVQTREGCVYFSWFVTFTIQPSTVLFSRTIPIFTHTSYYIWDLTKHKWNS